MAQRANVSGFEVAEVSDFVPCLDELGYFFVLCVDLLFEGSLRFDEMLVGGREVAASGRGPCDRAAYCYAGKSDD